MSCECGAPKPAWAERCVACTRKARGLPPLTPEPRSGPSDRERAYQAAYFRRRRARRLRAGACVKCGGARDGEPLTCTACRRQGNRHNRQSYRRLTDRGVCTACRRVRVHGRRLCAACGDARAARRKRLYDRRLDAGACTRCGGGRDAPTNECTACLARVRAGRTGKQGT